MADVVGFSKMMGRDEQRTTELILEFHDRVKEGIESHGGRVVGTAGDSVFGDFDSIVEAMELAAEMQDELHRRNESAPPEEQIVARIGLHLGDVIVDEYNVFGDGVNIAARLEQLADPGGILVSEAVYQQVKAHTELPFEPLGTRELKNIDQPIRVYRVGPEAFGGEAVRIDQSAASPKRPGRAERGVVIRDLLGSIKDEVRAEIESAQGERTERRPSDAEDRDISVKVTRSGRPVGLAVLFDPGTLTIAAIGVLGLLARTSGWTGNAVYPAFGAFLIGVALGRLVEGLSGRTGVGGILRAVGFGIGAAFFGNEVMKAIGWVAAVGMFGRAVQELRQVDSDD
jgi:class 3 adenylate cyclase